MAAGFTFVTGPLAWTWRTPPARGTSFPPAVSWILFDGILIATGLLLIADGLYWYIPAEKTRRQFPYCFRGMEIIIPDYGRPAGDWKRVTIEDEDF